jgi:hypothetical protein
VRYVELNKEIAASTGFIFEYGTGQNIAVLRNGTICGLTFAQR